MSKSNWKGSAAWQAVPDPTNILENTCLQLIPERNGVAEDYILQKIGTSTGLTYLNIGIKFNYAWPTNAQNSTDAEFGAIVRADNFTTGTTYCSMAENAYIGKLNKSDSTVYLCKRHNNSLLTIMTESISLWEEILETLFSPLIFMIFQMRSQKMLILKILIDI